MKAQWRPPALWEDFEDLCYRLALAKGQLTSLHKYGRRGQEQFGVDIVGASAGSRTNWTGIQCKLKTEHLESRLGANEIHAEYAKSKDFRPALTHWMIATTSSRDTSAQDVVNQINASFQRRHTAELWFWEDLCDLLDDYPKVAARFYPGVSTAPVDFVGGVLSAYLFADECGSGDKLQAFFSHHSFRPRLGALFQEVSTAILEAVDNCLHRQKGGATRIVIEFDGEEIRLCDNGMSFDPFDEQFQLGEQQFGLRAIRALRDPAKPITASYERRDAEEGITSNVLSIRLAAAGTEDGAARCTAHADVALLFNRYDAFEVIEDMHIPPDCDPYTLRLTGDSPLSLSGAHQLLLQIKQRLGQRALRVVVGPHRRHVFEALVGNSLIRESFEVVQD